jgi:hypothetical protein
MYRTGGISLFWLVYLVVGAVVAGDRNYFKNVENVERVVEAVLAVALWPLLLFDVSLRI